MNKQQKLGLVLFLLAISATFFFVFVNRSYLLNENEELLRYGITVVTADDASYLAPAENFLIGEGWVSNQPGKVKHTLRSPGYGMIYAGFRFFLSEKSALRAMVALQIFLFALAVCAVPKLYRYVEGDFSQNGGGYYLAGFIAVAPIFSGFLGYTLTEGITSALVVIFLFFLLDFHYSSRGFLAAGMVLGLLILIRPAMILWVLAPIVLFLSSAHAYKKKLLVIAAVGLLPLAIWQINISIKTNELQGLHPIYQSDSNDLYRPLHRDIWNFHKSWGQTGYDFNRTVNQLWTDALLGNKPDNTIDQIMRAIPDKCSKLIGYRELEEAYKSYFQVLVSQIAFYENKLPIPQKRLEEEQLREAFKTFEKAFIASYPFYALVAVPAKVYLELAAHSNLSLYVFQKPWRGKVLMEMGRYFAFAIHFGVFMLFPFAVVISRKNNVLLAIALPVLFYLGYLVFVQRGVEERYTLPVLIPMFLIVSYTIHTFCFRFRKNLFARFF